jgi:hypothetical protein
LKPCLHGSDYHGGKDGKNICIPDLNRFCWVKSDPTYEGLKQVIYEPLERVYIGENSPDDKLIYQIIDKVKFEDTNFTTKLIEINPNLTAIIGGKSTGKSVLLKNIAKSVDYHEYKNRIESAKIPDSKPLQGMEVFWKDGQKSSLGSSNNPDKKIIYIPQSYLNRVIDDDVIKTDIDDIIKDVLMQDESFELWNQGLTQKEKNIDENISTNIKVLFDLLSIYRDNSKELKRIGDEKGIEEQIKKIKSVIEIDEKKLNLKEEEKNEYREKVELIKTKKFEIERIEKDIKTLSLIKDENVEIYSESNYSFVSKNNVIDVAKLKKEKEEEYNLDWKKEIQKLVDSNLFSLSKIKKENEVNIKSIKHLQDKIDKQKTLLENYQKLEKE